MADLVHRGGYAGLGRRVGSGDGVLAVERAGLAAATVIARRGKAGETAARLGSRFGFAVVDGPKRAVSAVATVLGTGPGTWFVFGEEDPGFVAGLRAALAGVAAVVDQSDGQAVLHLSGARLPELLEKGVRIDLDPARFTPADVAVTAIAHIGVTLWKIDAVPTFAVALPRSYAASFRHWLETSAGPAGLTVMSD
ncbi:MAG: sarcosine oxidase subunit gamma family protein [Phreatobacter sp.]|uniref:sarcosine oxidase subunit gamma n=1 Tax=Phreatobacter sp. TaxID=1966341 RepID=UPI002732B5DB|nr:sarcosine oxidase subunit gamma family protein [Phreatobacter sp.]MDP2801488.1 sarcosine oxidase subunit gamma family protein [Phreatobacter sp.]